MISLLCAVLLFVAEPSDTTVVIGNVDVYAQGKKVSEAFLLSSSDVRKLSASGLRRG